VGWDGVRADYSGDLDADTPTGETRTVHRGRSILSFSVAPNRAPLQVVGVCGQTVAIIVNGAVVTFTCLPEGGEMGPDDPGSGIKPGPGPAPPNNALTLDATDLDGELMPHIPEQADSPEILTVEIATGSEVGKTSLDDLLTSARDEGRVPRIQIKP
jgi:hypothetical protein